MRNRGVQPAYSSLAYYLTIPQWRCKRGHWNDVSHVSRRCYGCCEQPKPCETCGGDGRFEEEDRTTICAPCAGWGIQWDWPSDEKSEAPKADDDIIFLAPPRNRNTTMPREPKDEYMVYVPDSATLPRHVFSYAAVDRALDELGRRAARVRRITEGELARDVTSQFTIIEQDEYPDEETAGRLFKASRAQHYAFGRR